MTDPEFPVDGEPTIYTRLTEREALLFKNILTNEQQARLAALELVRLTLGDRPDPSELIRLASWVLSGADTTG